MVTWKTDVDTIPLHTVLIVSDRQENVAIWDALFNQRNCIVLSESNVSDALQSARLIGEHRSRVCTTPPHNAAVASVASMWQVARDVATGRFDRRARRARWR